MKFCNVKPYIYCEPYKTGVFSVCSSSNIYISLNWFWCPFNLGFGMTMLINYYRICKVCNTKWVCSLPNLPENSYESSRSWLQRTRILSSTRVANGAKAWAENQPLIFAPNQDNRQYSRRLNGPSLPIRSARENILCPFIGLGILFGLGRAYFVPLVLGLGINARMHARKFASHSQKPLHAHEREFQTLLIRQSLMKIEWEVDHKT